MWRVCISDIAMVESSNDLTAFREVEFVARVRASSLFEKGLIASSMCSCSSILKDAFNAANSPLIRVTRSGVAWSRAASSATPTILCPRSFTWALRHLLLILLPHSPLARRPSLPVHQLSEMFCSLEFSLAEIHKIGKGREEKSGTWHVCRDALFPTVTVLSNNVFTLTNIITSVTGPNFKIYLTLLTSLMLVVLSTPLSTNTLIFPWHTAFMHVLILLFCQILYLVLFFRQFLDDAWVSCLFSKKISDGKGPWIHPFFWKWWRVILFIMKSRITHN